MSGWGCNTQSEFDCVSSLNDQSKANSLFQEHWNTWVPANDFKLMVDYGLNTVRIPVGYWFLESIVDSSEHFAQGGEKYLDQVVGWAKDAGLYVIIGLHGAPGAQATDAFTGQLNPSPAFFDDYSYDRAYQWLEWMTQKIHTNLVYSTVGMLELVNEPVRTWDDKYPDAQAQTDSMRKNILSDRLERIRGKEDSLQVSTDRRVHIQMMDQNWGSGDPKEFLTDLKFAAYDDHNYVKYSGVAQSKDAYIQHSCSDDRSGNWPVIVGEWSISVDNAIENTDEWNPNNNKDFYKRWWAAQVTQYEKSAQGWVFWTWHTSGLSDPRWDYKMAVDLGIVDKNPDVAYEMNVCG